MERCRTAFPIAPTRQYQLNLTQGHPIVASYLANRKRDSMPSPQSHTSLSIPSLSYDFVTVLRDKISRTRNRDEPRLRSCSNYVERKINLCDIRYRIRGVLDGALGKMTFDIEQIGLLMRMCKLERTVKKSNSLVGCSVTYVVGKASFKLLIASSTENLLAASNDGDNDDDDDDDDDEDDDENYKDENEREKKSEGEREER
ncbi:hypothetical protein V1478_013854 [Vespula squamosa]|uniref:Uncharacterized protein n=1 Tax=Vespula squamosa TaxID=30214 RepID=A0ABD2A6C4_VESSQ